MKGPDKVFALGEVDADFAADAGIDLGEESGGDLDEVDAPHVTCGGESRDISDEAPAERDDEGPSIEARGEHFVVEAFDGLKGLVLLPGGKGQDVNGEAGGGEAFGYGSRMKVLHRRIGDEDTLGAQTEAFQLKAGPFGGPGLDQNIVASLAQRNAYSFHGR